MKYAIGYCSNPPPPFPDWHAPAWQHAEIATISAFRSESSHHRPVTKVRLIASDTALHGIFSVEDQYVRCIRTGYGSEVWKDSCVEVFLEPPGGKGYFNFEFNCGGAFLCNYITDPTRTPTGFVGAVRLPEPLAMNVTVASTLPAVVDPEIKDPVHWHLAFHIPFQVLEPFAGPLRPFHGTRWRGNFFKCAEEVSHPHWASWSPVDQFNFHLPSCFGHLELRDARL